MVGMRAFSGALKKRSRFMVDEMSMVERLRIALRGESPVLTMVRTSGMRMVPLWVVKQPLIQRHSSYYDYAVLKQRGKALLDRAHASYEAPRHAYFILRGPFSSTQDVRMFWSCNTALAILKYNYNQS